MSQNGWDVAIRLVDGNEQAAPITDTLPTCSTLQRAAFATIASTMQDEPIIGTVSLVRRRRFNLRNIP